LHAHYVGLHAMNISPTIEQQKRFYAERWEAIDFAGRLKLLRSISILEAIAATKLTKPKIIDLGCGTGWLSAIVGLFSPTVAIELSKSAIAESSKQYKHVQFVEANIFDWEYPINMFDIAISQEVIEHVEDQERYVEISHAILKDDGYLILTTPNPATLNAMPEEQRTKWSNQPLESYISIDKLRSLLRRKYQINYVTTIILGYGTKGSYRIMNSMRLMSVMQKFRIANLFDEIRKKCGYGLHTVVLAKKINK